jgi:hypothetical protein
MMDTSSAAPQYNSYNDFIAANANRLRASVNPTGPAQNVTDMYAAPEAPAETVPAFPALVQQHEAANGKPLTEQELDALKDDYWKQAQPGIIASQKHPTKMSVGAEQAAFESRYNQFKRDYLRQHPEAAANAAKGGFIEGLTDFGKAAAGTIGQGAVEAARLVPGGVAAIGDAGYEALMNVLGHKDARGELADNWFNFIDNTIRGKQGEDISRRYVQEATARSPIAGTAGVIAGTVAPAFIGTGEAAAGSAIARALPAAAKIALPQTLSTVGEARDKGASVAQQEALLAAGLPTNIVANAIPMASKGAGVIARTLQGAATGAATGAVAQGEEHLIAPDQLAAPDLQSLGVAALIGGTVAHVPHINALRRPKVQPTPTGTSAPAGTTTPASTGKPAVDLSGTPIVGADGQPVMVPGDVSLPQVSSSLKPGAGISDAQHAKVLGEARVQALTPEFRKGIDGVKDPVARANEVVARAAVIAQDAADEAGGHWETMTIDQRQSAVEEAAMALAKSTKTDGVPEVLAAARAQANAAPAAAPVGEIPGAPSEPAPAAQSTPRAPVPGTITPNADGSYTVTTTAGEMQLHGPTAQAQATKLAAQIREAAAASPAAEIPGMESGAAPARAIAEGAMADAGTPPSPVAPTAPGEAAARTAAQAEAAGSPVEVQGHAQLDELLRAAKKAAPGLGKTITKATLAKMTAGDKVKMLADLQGQIDAAKAKANAPKKTKTVAKAPKPNMAEATQGPPAGSSGTLPEGLAKAAPRYNYGTKGFTPTFANDVDKAAYIIAGTGKSAAHTQYMEFVKQQLGVDDAGAIAHGKKVREQLKAQAKEAKAGTPLKVAEVPRTEPPVESTPPKAAAPEAAQPPAAEASPAPETARSNESPANQSDPIAALLEGKVADLAEVRNMVERAREGDNADLQAFIREARASGDLDAEGAKTLRRLGREKPIDMAQRDSAATKAADAKPDPLLRDPVQAEAERAKPPVSEEGKAAEVVSQQAEELAAKSNRLKSNKARVADVIAKLRANLIDTNHTAKAIDFLEWVLDKNPALINTLNDVHVKARVPGSQVGGSFKPVGRILEIVNSPTLNETTPVHELLHASESLLPQNIRDALTTARRAEVARMAETGTPNQKAFFEYLKGSLDEPTAGGKAAYMEAAKQEFLRLVKDPSEPLTAARQRDLYALTNASEFWAVHASEMIHGGYLNQSVVSKIKSWLAGFVKQLQFLYGNKPNKQAVIDGINAVMSHETGVGSADFLRNYEITKKQYSGQPEALTPVGVEAELHDIVVQSPRATAATDNPRTKLDNLRETIANNAVSFQRVGQTLRRIGVKLPDKLDPYLSAVRLPGVRENLRAIDNAAMVEPIKTYMASHWQRFGKTDIEAVDKAGLFFQVHHALTERLPTEYAQQVPLNNGMEVRRQRILAQVDSLALTPKDADTQLNALVQQHASMPLDAWARQAKGDQYAQLVKKQGELAAAGMTPQTMKDLNGLVQTMNDRARSRLIESGKVAKDDPWKEFYGWKWYVPLKGGAYDGVVEAGRESALLPNELSAITRQGRGYITNLAQLNTAEGRASWASNPLLRAIVDTGNAATASADHGFTGDMLTLVNSMRKELRTRAKGITDPAERERITRNEFHNTQTHVFTGTPHEGYVDARTGKHYDTLPPIKNSLVHNDGRTHYIMEFPEGSEMYHGLQSINTNWDPREFPILKPVIEAVEAGINKVIPKKLGLGEQTHLITRSTQMLGKLNTVVNPIWTGMVQLPRTMMEKPFMLAIKEGAGVIDGAQLAGRAYVDILQGVFGGGKDVSMLIRHDHAGLRAAGEAAPDSWAGWWKRMNDAGGGAAFTQGLTMHETNNALAKAIRDTTMNPLSKAGHTYMKYALGWSDALENLSSVGIFKSLVKAGMDEATAAAKTKDLLNFQQTGTAGRAMNGYKAYFRITMTVNETMMRAFQHPEGRRPVTVMGRTFNTSIDWGKVAKWGSVMASYAAMKYAFDRELMGKDENGTYNIAKAISTNPYTLIEKSFLPQGSTDHPYALPVGLGFPQLLTAPGTLAAALAYGDIDRKQAGKALWETMQRNVSVIDPVSTPENGDAATHLFAYAMGALQPTAMQPASSLLITNTDNFGRPIHTEFSDPKKFAADQGKRNTPEFWKDTAQEIRQMTGVDMYPETLPYVVRNYGGSAINDILRFAIGQNSRVAQGLPNNALSATSRVQVNNADYYYSGQMYKTLNELSEVRKQLNHVQLSAGPAGSAEFSNAGQAWLSQNPDAQRQLQALADLTKAQKTYNRALKELMASKDGPDRKQYVRKQLDSALRVAVDKAKGTLQ